MSLIYIIFSSLFVSLYVRVCASRSGYLIGRCTHVTQPCVGLPTLSCPEVERGSASQNANSGTLPACMRATRAAASPESCTVELYKAAACSRTARATFSHSRSEAAAVAVQGREAMRQRRVRTARSPVSAAAIRKLVAESQRTLRAA